MARAVKPGHLDARITLYRPTSSLEGYNEVVDTFSVHATSWAEKRDVSTAEAMRAREIGAEIDCRFTVRWSAKAAAVDPTFRIGHGGRVYNVTGVRALGRRDFVEIDAVARAQADLVVVFAEAEAEAITWAGRAITWAGEQITWGAP